MIIMILVGLQTEMSNVYIQEPPTSGKVCLKTTVGDIDVELWSKECPKACRNFIQLCMNEYYNETVFHRVVPGFIVQGGDPTGTGLGGESIYGEPFKDEFHSRLRFVRRGLVAMANSGPNDNGSQFFFTLDKAPELQGKHTIFGKVVGNTLFNMLKLGECEVDKNERPTYPHKIIKTEILNNPFPHIVPMKVESKKERTSEWRKDKSDVKVEKNFGLLSFGDEAEEEDGTNKAFSGKTRSTHDVEGVHGLSAEPAARKEELYQPEEEKNEEEKQKHLEEKERMKRRIAEKLKGAGEQMKNTAQKAIEEDEEDFDNLLFSERRKEQKAQVEALKAEYKQLQKEMVKKAKMDGKKDGVEEESSNKSTTGDDDADKNPLLAAVRAERRKYSAEGKDIPSRKSDERQKATLAMLERFKEKLETVKQKRVGDEEDTEKNVPTTTSTSSNIQSNISDYMDVEDDAPGDDWMAHRFEVREEQELLKQAKDANVKSVDSFDIYDPRNPMTKRRREKDRASEKKHGGSHGRHERVDESQSSKRSRYDR